jgi:hypothetical protein
MASLLRRQSGGGNIRVADREPKSKIRGDKGPVVSEHGSDRLTKGISISRLINTFTVVTRC